MESARLVLRNILFNQQLCVFHLCLDVGSIQVNFDTPVVYLSHGGFHAGQTIDHNRNVTVEYLVGGLGEVSVEFQADAVVD